ncbi:hypothetical protein KC19_2G174700 [Ceratodon purpureus]|uniref:Uncharacterized protein n=1 Tax=Ceratodon purpureus TaxID=3225 RepID=A0A8T0IY06_CERPU|nr:hypothetical protein KC19_2G174700 [Ceratodon purpureus]
MLTLSPHNRQTGGPTWSSKRVQTRSPRLQPVVLAKSYQPHHFTAYFQWVCALRRHICAREDSLQRQCRLCFPHTYDIALLRLLSFAQVRFRTAKPQI